MRRPFSKIEDSLEFIVERPFAKLFRRSVQPAEIGKRLKKELMSGEIVSVRGRVAPNDYVVFLNPDDAAPYQEHGRLLADDLAEWLEEIALASNLVTLDAIQVRFETDPSLRSGRFEVRSAVQEAPRPPVRFEDPGSTEPFEVAGRAESSTRGFIEICSGPSIGTVFPVRKHIVSIGRDLGNDLVIDNPEVSRFHAELEAAAAGMTLRDQGSTNGTYVNGIEIQGLQFVESGDQIIFGTTVCRFWADLL